MFDKTEACDDGTDERLCDVDWVEGKVLAELQI
jgi:hypothetical protein